MITKEQPAVRTLRCAIYTRKSTDKNLETDYNSLDAQREVCEAYIASQRHEGWICLPELYDDGGFSGGNMERPAMQQIIRDIEIGLIDAVVVYKIDRISRSLFDFAKLMEMFEKYNVAFTSITQQFSTGTAMGRLTLNVLLSFAEFERAIGTERVRDKIAGAKKRGKYLGGTPAYSYDIDYTNKRLVVNPVEAKTVRWIFRQYTETGSLMGIAKELNAKGITTKSWTTKNGTCHRGSPWTNQHIYRALNNKTYLGLVEHNGETYSGEHEAIISQRLWDDVQSLFASSTGRKRGQQTHETKALLRGIIKCGHCGTAMKPTYSRGRHKDRIYRYYVCQSASKRGYDSCPVRSIPSGEIETAVLEQLRAILKTPEMIAQTYRAAKNMTAERDNEFEGIGVTETEVAALLKQLDPVWDQLFPAEQQRIFKALVDKVVVTENGIDISLCADGLYSVAAELK
ncbi:MAG: recombinase family protein [Armatimonadetes bacterium]|nr:recombinase family protein [Armatimonadota bacterium]